MGRGPSSDAKPVRWRPAFQELDHLTQPFSLGIEKDIFVDPWTAQKSVDLSSRAWRVTSTRVRRGWLDGMLRSCKQLNGGDCSLTGRRGLKKGRESTYYGLGLKNSHLSLNCWCSNTFLSLHMSRICMDPVRRKRIFARDKASLSEPAQVHCLLLSFLSIYCDLSCRRRNEACTFYLNFNLYSRLKFRKLKVL